jgi:hypothetical protein
VVDGTLVNRTVDGTLVDCTVVDGTLVNRTVDGTLVDCTVVDGTLVDFTVVDGTLVDGITDDCVVILVVEHTVADEDVAFAFNKEVNNGTREKLTEPTGIH